MSDLWQWAIGIAAIVAVTVAVNVLLARRPERPESPARISAAVAEQGRRWRTDERFRAGMRAEPDGPALLETFDQMYDATGGALTGTALRSAVRDGKLFADRPGYDHERWKP